MKYGRAQHAKVFNLIPFGDKWKMWVALKWLRKMRRQNPIVVTVLP